MNKWTKKVAYGAAVLSLGGFLAACGNGGEDSTDDGGDTVTAASITADADEVEASLGEDGNWITALTDDVDLGGDVTVAGTFYNQDNEDDDVYRKLALYDQDDDMNVTDEYTLAVGTLTVESPNFRIQNGILDGDVYVNEEGFELEEGTITGNLTFSSQEFEDSANLNGTVEGETSVEE